MGDRTWLHLNYLKSEEKEIDKIFEGFNEIEESDATIYGFQGEVEGGGFDQTSLAIKKKLTFWGSHGTGDNYGPLCFACCRGFYAETKTDHDGSPVITLASNGIMDLADVKAARKYFIVQKMVDIEVEKEEMRIQVVSLGEHISATSDVQVSLKKQVEEVMAATKLSDLEEFMHDNELSKDITAGSPAPVDHPDTKKKDITERIGQL